MKKKPVSCQRKKLSITCPHCHRKLNLYPDWWESQPTNVAECPYCLNLIEIDSDCKVIDFYEKLKCEYRKFKVAPNKRFAVKESDLISYIPAESWPEDS